MTVYSVDYSISLYSSLIISIVISIFLTNISCKNNKEFLQGNSIVSSSIWLVGFISFTAVIYCVTYTIFNFINQDNILKTFEFELKNGVIALRVSSIILIWNFFSLASKVSLNIENGIKLNLNLPQHSKMEHISGLKEVYNSLDSVIVLQIIFYFQALFVSWFFAINNIHTLLPNILNWLVFFIIDDWIIISTYCVYLGGYSVPSHLKRITIFNIFITVLIILCAINYFNWMFNIIYIPILLMILLARYLTRKN